MPKLDDQISTLQQRLQQLKLRQQRVDARKRAIAASRDRKSDTRRKILLGTLLQERMLQGDVDRQQVLAWLDLALARPGDRALFDLPPAAPTAHPAEVEPRMDEVSNTATPTRHPAEVEPRIDEASNVTATLTAHPAERDAEQG